MVKSTTKQMKKWMDDFGRKYTKRNFYTPQGVDSLWKRKYGISRTEMNRLFVGNLSRNIKILEVGTNIGNQLSLLQNLGFKNLYGIEINNYAIKRAHARGLNLNIIYGSVFDIPFKDDYFDLVFTSGVLIHIAPADINKALREIYRCANKYIWGKESYADEYASIMYRGNRNLMWKANFPKLYFDLFGDLKLAKEKRLKFLDNSNVDIMFLLKK